MAKRRSKTESKYGHFLDITPKENANSNRQKYCNVRKLFQLSLSGKHFVISAISKKEIQKHIPLPADFLRVNCVVMQDDKGNREVDWRF